MSGAREAPFFFGAKYPPAPRPASYAQTRTNSYTDSESSDIKPPDPVADFVQVACLWQCDRVRRGKVPKLARCGVREVRPRNRTWHKDVILGRRPKAGTNPRVTGNRRMGLRGHRAGGTREAGGGGR